jgi:hypothetical protein
LDREANDLETDQRGHDSRPSGEIPGEPMDDTASVVPIQVPLSPPPPPPPPAVPIVIMDGPPPRRRGRIVRVQSPEAPEPSPVIIQVPTSRSSSRSETYLAQPQGVYHAETGYSRRTDATGRELESVISDFSSIVIVVRIFQLTQITFLPLLFVCPGYLPCLSIYRDARVGSQRL